MERIIEWAGLEGAKAELFRAVMRQLEEHSLTFEEVLERPEDYADARAGVPGFIYYLDTEPFATKNCHLITQVLFELESEIGPLEKDTQNVLNWMAWFALEWAIGIVMDYKGA